MLDKNIPALILVSTSPYRQELMQRAGLRCHIVAPRFEETHIHNGDPAELALALARGKVMSVAADFPNAILIGSDQIVWFENRVLLKPGTPERALAELMHLRGHTHEFFMGLFLFHTGLSASQECVVQGTAKLRADLTEEELRRYIAIDHPVNCAGSAKIEGAGLLLFERMDCEDWTAIIGLPMIQLATALRRWGYPIFEET